MAHLYSQHLAKQYSLQRNRLRATDKRTFALLKRISIIRKYVLDFGCGDGGYAMQLSRMGARKVVGIDISPTMIKLANRNLKKEQIKNVEFMQADGAQLHFHKNTFDVAFSNFVLHHFQDISAPLNEISRVLKKSGYLLATLNAYKVKSRRFIDAIARSAVPMRLGTGRDSFVVTAFLHTNEDIKSSLIKTGFKVLFYKVVQNPNAAIDSSYHYINQVSYNSLLFLARKM
ncbi:MAG: class I SAM-dependent methyltransferase [Candidatus Niyogibacteria bacterium]|nr:class I SAM-dependent methyltransferase [Candidatus Niyogibacteria bacterium]